MSSSSRTRQRDSSGNTLVLTFACIFLVFVVGIFAFDMVRQMGSYYEQNTAIEAASLTAARDIGRVTIEDPEFGLVGLCDYAPIGTKTAAQDNYYMPVKSINSILATIRLNMIIADQLADPLIKRMAERDYTNAMQTKDKLVAELKRCIKKGETFTDIDGKTINIYDDAETAYTKNAIRMARGKASLKMDSLVIKLGTVPAINTNVSIPKPTSFAQMSADQQKDECYVAYVNIPYNQRDFVFAATSSTTSLIDHHKFQENIPELPYTIPSIVSCEADEIFQNDPNSTAAPHTVHSIACSEPMRNLDFSQKPGAFTVTFADSALPEVTDLFMIFSDNGINNSPTDRLESPSTGDYPATALSEFTIPQLNSEHPLFGALLRVGLYDWIRRGGERLDIQSLIDAFHTPLSTSAGDINSFEMQKDGKIKLSTKNQVPTMELPVSNKQWRAISGIGVHSKDNKFFDVIGKDFTYQPGRTKGGDHGGEPLGVPKPASTVGVQTSGLADNPALLTEFPQGPGGGGPRPTYIDGGTSFELRFRLRPNQPL